MRPTIALCMIMKDEEKNLSRVLSSVEGCFDEIHLTDTGSKDKSVDVAKSFGANVHHFEWINDFSAARNYSFSHAKSDYIMWLDCDDELENKEAFFKWRDNAMLMNDYWLNNYHYALNDKGEPICTFSRERVVKNGRGFKWKYFLHEGIPPVSDDGREVRSSFINTWSVKHHRTAEDLKKDKGRNIGIIEEHIDKGEKLDPRMSYYYGKELHEAGRTDEAIKQLGIASSDPKLEFHDRLLCLQYLCISLMKKDGKENLVKCIEVAQQGLLLSAHRAEFYCFIGDAYLKLNRFHEAIPSFEAAKRCMNTSAPRPGMASPIFSYGDVYGPYPTKQLIRIYCKLDDPDRAMEQVEYGRKHFGDDLELQAIAEHAERLNKRFYISGKRYTTEDIVFTCPPMNLYEWDYEIYKEKGIGGSETALVEMAYWLKKLTNRRVMVFHTRKENKVIEGVEYFRIEETFNYLDAFEPKLHIAWRHGSTVTRAKTLIWSHDLITKDATNPEKFHKILCLSDFHARYYSSMLGVDEKHIDITSNGIDPNRFKDLKIEKIPGKIVYSSSPDRGLKETMLVMDEVVKEIPEAKLHVFYGFNNMEKFGLNDQINELKKMIDDRDHVIFHGNVSQKQLAQEFSEAEVWLYPTWFFETYCITAIEALCCQVYPVVRNIGALQDTLKDAATNKMAQLLDVDPQSKEGVREFSHQTIDALKQKKWQNVKIDPEIYSWESVAKRWIEDYL